MKSREAIQPIQTLIVSAVLFLLILGVASQQSALAYWIYPTITYKDSNANKNQWYTDGVYSTRYKEIMTVDSFYTQFGTVTVTIKTSNGSSVSAQSSFTWTHSDANLKSQCRFTGSASGPIPIKCQYQRMLWIT